MKKPFYNRKERQMIVNYPDCDTSIELLDKLKRLKLLRAIRSLIKTDLIKLFK